jgi:hypothetical protein
VPSAPIVGECQNFDSICKLYTVLLLNLIDFAYELSNYKSEQLLPSSIMGSWWFFRARVDQLHMSNNASHIFFSVYRSKNKRRIRKQNCEVETQKQNENRQ